MAPGVNYFEKHPGIKGACYCDSILDFGLSSEVNRDDHTLSKTRLQTLDRILEVPYFIGAKRSRCLFLGILNTFDTLAILGYWYAINTRSSHCNLAEQAVLPITSRYFFATHLRCAVTPRDRRFALMLPIGLVAALILCATAAGL
jgi:hypothetical protein